MELRVFADRSIDLVGLRVVRVVEEGEIGFDGGDCRIRQLAIGGTAQDRLATDYDDVLLADDVGHRPQDVGEFVTRISGLGFEFAEMPRESRLAPFR